MWVDADFFTYIIRQGYVTFFIHINNFHIRIHVKGNMRDWYILITEKYTYRKLKTHFDIDIGNFLSFNQII